LKPRLKSHKSGARYLLRPEDVVIASYFPISLKAHQVRCIISHGRDAERGEWTSTQPFSHSTRETTSDQIDRLESLFHRLAELQPWANADGYSEDYEEPVRRTMRFWIDRTEIGAFLPRRSFWTMFGVTDEGVAAFHDAWSYVWRCAGSENDIDLSTPSRKHD